MLRELIVALDGNEQGMGIGLATWLVGLALGALCGRLPSRERGESWLRVSYALMALSAPLGILWLRGLSGIFAAGAGEVSSLAQALLLAGLALAPAGAAVGFTFTLIAAFATTRVTIEERAVSRVYVVEALGFLLGGLVTSFVLTPYLPPLAGSVLLSASCLALALPVAPRSCALLAVGLALFAFLGAAASADRASLAWAFEKRLPGVHLVDARQSVYQLSALGGPAPFSLYLSGQYAGSFPDPTLHESMAHRLACLSPRPARVLSAGTLHLGTLRHLLKHPVQQVDLVELDRKAFRLVRDHLPAEDQQALEDERVGLHFGDLRTYLAEGEESYSLILLLMPPAETLLHARLGTVEFYRQVAHRLDRDGALVVSLPSPPNALEGEEADLAASVYRTLRELFPVVRAVPGADGFLVAGWDAERVSVDPELLAARYRARGIESTGFAAELFGLELPRDRSLAYEEALSERAAALEASRDARPASFLYGLSLRSRISGGRGGWWSARPRALVVSCVIPSLICLAWIALRRRRGRKTAIVHLTTVCGAGGMGWWLLLVFAYQVHAGALYGHMAVLSALFMVGLAGGGALFMGYADRFDLRAVSVLALLMSVLIPLSLGFAMTSSLASGTLIIAAGFVTGTVFPAAAGALASEGRTRREIASVLTCSDHFGAALASLLASCLLIPILGLPGTAWLIAVLVAVAILGLLVPKAPVRGRN